MDFDTINTVLTVPGLEPMLDFFEGFCGFGRFRDWDADHSRGVILRATDTAEVELIAPPDGVVWDSYTSGAQVSINVGDADAWAAAIEADGRFEVVDPIADRSFGVRSLGVRLSPGVVVYIVERPG